MAEKIEAGPSGGMTFLIIIIFLVSIILGFMLGRKLPSRCALHFICLLDAVVLSMVIYGFLMSFAGNWIVLIVSLTILLIVCTILPIKFD